MVKMQKDSRWLKKIMNHIEEEVEEEVSIEEEEREEEREEEKEEVEENTEVEVKAEAEVKAEEEVRDLKEGDKSLLMVNKSAKKSNKLNKLLLPNDKLF